jgi:hypothetical protein
LVPFVEGIMSRLLGLVCVLAACGSNSNPPGDDDDDSMVDAGDDDDEGGGSVAPQAGPWGYNDTLRSSTCPQNTPTGELGGFGIDQVTANTFRVLPNDGTAAFSCNFDSTGFECPDRGALTEDLRPTIDAVITIDADASGVFPTSRSGNGEQSATVTCAGTQCAVLGATFPCTIVLDFTIEAAI